MSRFPRDLTLDSSLSFLRHGYSFAPSRIRKHGTDAFVTRLMFRKAIVTSGQDAAEMFYQPGRFTRTGAMPPTTLRLLQDFGSVQMQDGADHQHRKAMFMQMMGPERVADLLQVSGEEWERWIVNTPEMRHRVLIDEAEYVLCRAAVRWAGLTLSGRQVRRRTREFSAMISGAGSVGPTMWRALLLRERCERWARKVIIDVRSGKRKVPPRSAVATLAQYRDRSGELLPVGVAAVELINVLRPIVAVARYVVFIAHALEVHPESRRFLTSNDDTETEWLVQEVRRFYPFFPFIAGVVREPFEWHDRSFREGEWVILDIFGTNRDPSAWEHPAAFMPERFRDRVPHPYSFIPQGGGDHLTTHRCAGEPITIALMKQAADLFANRMRYTVPAQDLSISLRKMPALPESGFIITDVEPAP